MVEAFMVPHLLLLSHMVSLPNTALITEEKEIHDCFFPRIVGHPYRGFFLPKGHPYH
jgi:hypothetical protein